MCSINILKQTIECVTRVDIQYDVLVLAISGCIHKDPPLNSNNIIHGAIKDKVLIKFCNYLHCWTITFQEMEDILMGFRISIQYPSGSLMKASPFIFPTKYQENSTSYLVSIHNSFNRNNKRLQHSTEYANGDYFKYTFFQLKYFNANVFFFIKSFCFESAVCNLTYMYLANNQSVYYYFSKCISVLRHNH